MRVLVWPMRLAITLAALVEDGPARPLAPALFAMYIHHVAEMVRKQVYLTVEQDRMLRRAAKKNRRTEAEIIREALDRTLGGFQVDDLDDDPLWGLVGIHSHASDDLSERVDDVVYGTREKK